MRYSLYLELQEDLYFSKIVKEREAEPLISHKEGGRASYFSQRGLGLSWQVVYKSSVKKDLKKISKNIGSLIQKSIEQKLMQEPLKFGRPLRQSLKAYRKLRGGIIG